MYEEFAPVRLCAHPLCGLLIEADRARDARYCKQHGKAEAAKMRRVYRRADAIVQEWRAGHQELVRNRTRLYVQQFRARKKLQQMEVKANGY
jgi:hypothetical protein